MKVAFSVARNIVVMHQGQVFAQGTPEDIGANTSSYTGMFLKQLLTDK